MPMNVQCQSCGSVFQVPDTAAGTQFQCSSCGQPLTAPQATGSNPLPAPQGPMPHAPPAQQYAVPAQPPAARSGGGGCLIGCVVAVVVVGVVGVGVYFVVRQIKREVEEVVEQVEQVAGHVSGWVGMIKGLEQLGNVEEIIAEYEEKGYDKIEQQVVTETEPINDKRLYVCQVLEIKSDVNEDIAILAQSATIHGTVDGDLEFGGQVLTIEKDAVIKGNVHSRLAQMIVVKGVVEGKLTGGYQALNAERDAIKGGR